jgi:Zn-finger nucleic acid-binding protein
MNCPKCKVELVRAVDWSYCPECNAYFSKHDLKALQEIANALLRKDLRDLADLELEVV